MAYAIVHGKLVKVGKGKSGLAPVAPPLTKAEVEKKSRKGVMGENCNRTACQRPPATYYNLGSHSFYCRACAEDINHDGCLRFGEPILCYEAVPLEQEQDMHVGWIEPKHTEIFWEGPLGVVTNPKHELFGRVVMKRDRDWHSFMIMYRQKATPEQFERAVAAYEVIPQRSEERPSGN